MNWLKRIWRWLFGKKVKSEPTEPFKLRSIIPKTTGRYRKNCIQCKEPMLLSSGQLAYWHKECRTKGRELFTKEYYRNV